MDKRILLVGTVSNVSKTLEKELRIVLEALSEFDLVEVFLVESDSSDQTVTVLERLKKSILNLEFVALGKIKEIVPDRISRIAFCRNVYVKYIRDNYAISKWDYVAVADLDGMNFKLSRNGIRSCFETNTFWNGIMANQSFGYYDLYALRAVNWVEGDCFEELEIEKRNAKPHRQSKYRFFQFILSFKHHDKLRKTLIYDRMKVVSKKSDLIEVKSAFGGFAIYKPDIFFKSDYKNDNTNVISEHVAFHLKLVNDEARFFINPKLINNHLNIYNLNKLTIVRFLRELKKFFKSEILK
jgi:hypothetical protein